MIDEEECPICLAELPIEFLINCDNMTPFQEWLQKHDHESNPDFSADSSREHKWMCENCGSHWNVEKQTEA